MIGFLKEQGIDKEESGIVGIGTMIVFIAMIIVASVAAGVLINTSGSLQQQARATGEETISEVSSGVKVLAAKGYTTSSNDTPKVNRINLIVRPYAGSQGINLENTVIQYKSEYEVQHLTSADFSITELQDASNTGKTMLETMGDIVQITIENDAANDNDFTEPLKPSDSATITFYPNSGFKTVYGISIPPTTENTTWYEL